MTILVAYHAAMRTYAAAVSHNYLFEQQTDDLDSLDTQNPTALYQHNDVPHYMEKYELRLYDPATWQVRSNPLYFPPSVRPSRPSPPLQVIDRMTLEENEVVLSLKVILLRTAKRGRTPFLVAG